MTIDTSTPTTANTFRRTTNDYWGFVDSSGNVEGGSITTNPTAPEGALAGQDLDDSGSGLSGDAADIRTATWSLALPGDAVIGTGLTSIDFSGLFAARESDVWDSTDLFSFELFLNGASDSVIDIAYDRANDDDFNERLAFDLDGNGIGEGTLISSSGSTTSLAAAGGVSISSVSVVFSGHADSGGEAFWTNGTLMAQYQAVPEASQYAAIALFATLIFGVTYVQKPAL